MNLNSQQIKYQVKKLKRKQILKTKKKEIDSSLSESACQIYNLIVTPE